MAEFDWNSLEELECPKCGSREFKVFALGGRTDFVVAGEATHYENCYEVDYTLVVECDECDHKLYDVEDEVYAAIRNVLEKESPCPSTA